VSAKARTRKIIALDWDAKALRVVHATLGKRGASIDRLLSAPIAADVDTANPEAMGRFIRRVLDQEGIPTRHAVVDIPRDQAILNTLKLPVNVPDELPGIVQIQIAKELPFPVSAAVVDFAVEASHGDSVTADVLVAAIRREVLDQYVQTFEIAGLRLDRVGLRPYANKVAVCQFLRHALPERVLFLDLRPTLTEITILRNASLVFSRAASVMIPAAAQRPPGLSLVREEQTDTPYGLELHRPEEASTPDDAIRSLVVEVTRSIEAYRANDPGARIDHVVIAGDQGIEDALGEAIQKHLNVTAENYNPASTFGWEPDEGAGASAFAALLGLVLGHADAGALHFDFLHPKKAGAVTKQRLRKVPVIAAVAVLFLMATVVGVYGVTKGPRERLAEIERLIAEYESQAEENEKFLKFMSEIRKFDQQFVWVDVLSDVMACLPSREELVVTRITMNQDDHQIILKTDARQRDTALGAVQRLHEFRRDGRKKPRFEAAMGAQTEKPDQAYAYQQDLRITVLSDVADGGDEPSSRRSE